MIGSVVCSQRPSCHQFVTRQPQSSRQSNRHTPQHTEQMSPCQNQSRRASYPPLIKVASNFSRSEDQPYYGKWNDKALARLEADGSGGLRLCTLNLFSPKRHLKAHLKYEFHFPICLHGTSFYNISYQGLFSFLFFLPQ